MSKVEQSTDLLIATMNLIQPGVIMVSGGEPVLWKAMPRLIEELGQHKWVILTNLSKVPAWLLHDRVVLVIAAYHKEFTHLPTFIKNLKRIYRPIVKILVEPNSETEHLSVWDTLWTHGIPTHLAPIEWPRGFSESFLDRIRSGELLTNLMYNSRFFCGPTNKSRLCIAGTRDMFQIGLDGGFGRCSQGGPIHGRLGDQKWLDEPHECSFSCYCEWHHWAGMTLANDNNVWNRYVDTGIWTIPRVDELKPFVEKMEWKL